MNAGFGKRGMSALRAAKPTQAIAQDENAPSDASGFNPKLWVLILGLAGIAVCALLVFLAVKTDIAPPPPLGDDGKPIALIPRSELPTVDTKDLSVSLQLIERYPDDPRAHLFRGLYFLERKDLADSERELRLSLKRPEILDRDLEPYLSDGIRVVLASILAVKGRKPEAIAIAKDVCGKNKSSLGRYGEYRDMLTRYGICSARS